MASVARCPTCKKSNRSDGRYCIHCGAILSPTFCSSCGTINPGDLGQCLECGNPLPNLAEVRWKPIVTMIQPTSAMVDRVHAISQGEPEQQVPEPENANRGIISRLRALLGGGERGSVD